ncbi:DUF302 domain-containing protein [Alkalihalophilus pseudofirmus]|uniref:DUF302 domain-containing protein n=1 Tax=Alkalihalophilus pseudofirmus TaxID=79885 RepID=A0AAJ2KV27_ALKPS|nr:DUF302 domain-containing protein [Alkalihalophilus pseudofirmus]MDV2883786.1 DUF302 domain-containing protein [Alkalihalophilus pseudofirmus]
MFHVTVKSPHSINETVEKLTANLKEQEFGVLWDFDLRGKLEEKGQTFEEDFRVLEVCNPKVAKDVLTRNLLAGYFLPCKMVVYVEDGVTKIGMPKPTHLISALDDSELTSHAEAVEERLTIAMNQTVNG